MITVRHREHTAFVGIRQHTSAYVSIRQHTSWNALSPAPTSCARSVGSIRQHTSAYVSIRKRMRLPARGARRKDGRHCVRMPPPRLHTHRRSLRRPLPLHTRFLHHCFCCSLPSVVYVSIRQHTSAYVSIRQRMLLPAFYTTDGKLEQEHFDSLNSKRPVVACVSIRQRMLLAAFYRSTLIRSTASDL